MGSKSFGLVKGLMWVGANAVFTQGAVLLIGILIANELGHVTFGEYTFLRNLFIACIGFFELGGGLVANRFIADYKTDHAAQARELLLKGFRICTMLGVLGAGVAVYLAYGTLGAADHSINTYVFGAVYVLAAVLGGLQAGAMAGLGQFSNLAILGAVSGCALLLLSTAGIYLAGIPGAVAALAIYSLLRVLLMMQSINSWMRKAGVTKDREALPPGAARRIANFAVPIALSGMLVYPVPWICNLILIKGSSGLSSVADFNAHYQIRMLLLVVPALLFPVAVSVLNSKQTLAVATGFRDQFLLNLRLNLILSVAAATVLFCLSTRLIVIFGPEFSVKPEMLALLLTSGILESVSLALYQVLQSENKVWSLLIKVVLPREVATIGISYLTVPALGEAGVAVALVVSWAMATILLWRLVRASPLIARETTH